MARVRQCIGVVIFITTTEAKTATYHKVTEAYTFITSPNIQRSWMDASRVVEIVRLVRDRCTMLRNYDVLGGHGCINRDIEVDFDVTSTGDNFNALFLIQRITSFFGTSCLAVKLHPLLDLYYSGVQVLRKGRWALKMLAGGKKLRGVVGWKNEKRKDSYK